MIDQLRTRRSIRKYRAGKVDPEKVKILQEALLRSPTSRRFDHWEFVFVDDEALLEKLSKSKKHGSSFLASAPLAIVVCGDTSRTDMWPEDCSIAAAYAHLAAHSLGLGSCWIQIRARMHDEGKSADEYVRGLLDIPANYGVECVLSVGEPDEEKEGHAASKLEFGKIHANGW
ncbi:MAG: nitroreductase family protein [Planctomycetota bacterium]